MKHLFGLMALATTVNFAFAAEPVVVINEGGADVVMEIRLDYSSRFKKSDVDAIINPENDRIQDLFKDPISLSGRNRSYDVKTSINAPMINMDFNCKLAYQQNRLGALTRHIFSFTEFDRLFKSSTIRVETKESGANTKVSIVQVAVIKSAPYAKIKKVPLGVGVKTFKSKIVANLNKFQKSTGGI